MTDTKINLDAVLPGLAHVTVRAALDIAVRHADPVHRNAWQDTDELVGHVIDTIGKYESAAPVGVDDEMWR